MDDVEQEAVLKWKEEDQPCAASALAGAKGELPRRRRLDVAIRMKRAWGSLLGSWCVDKKVDLRRRLPWGTMARFWQDQCGKRDFLDDRLLLRFTRKWQCGELMVKGMNQSLSTRRRREGAGRPHKAPALRELLFEWFCQIRGVLTSRLPVAALAAQARVLRERYMKRALDYSMKVNVPQINSVWLRDWRKQYGVCLRIGDKNNLYKYEHQKKISMTF